MLIQAENEYLNFMSKQLPEIIFNDFRETVFQPDAVVSFKLIPDKWQEKSLHVNLEKIPWSTHGYYLPVNMNFITDPLWHGGYYYVQEPSSMIIDSIISRLSKDITSPLILDFCAAPGGKTAGLLINSPSTATIVANEWNAKRRLALLENLNRLGLDNFIVTGTHHESIQKCGPLFDIIVCDAPCSGEGLFRKIPHSVYEWSIQKVNHSAGLQLSMLQGLWETLKPGGYLIYSTCTFNTIENENVILQLINTTGAKNIFFDELCIDGICNLQIQGVDAYRFFPHLSKGEGFFCCILKKSFEQTTLPNINITQSENPLSQPYLLSYFKQEQSLICEKNIWWAGGNLKVKSYLEKNNIQVIQNGIPVFLEKKHKVHPLQDLITHGNFNPKSLPSVDLELNDAYKYLSHALNWQHIINRHPYFYFTYKNFPFGLAQGKTHTMVNKYPLNRKIQKRFSTGEINTLLNFI
ncbi:MAG: rRNA cytosine-C5-methyltransferase [Vicingaceae bacterium]|nr:MAG: rRNA cytosine-C5-methyltransferase [Vicingaceae bacterium]